MLQQIAFLIVGLLLLVKGAGWLVDSASSLAKKYRVSDLTIGLTIVAFGTSAPELIVNVVASTQGHQGIVLGNILGSNLFNLFAILGIAGIITPLVVQSDTVWKEIPLSLFAVIFFYVLANDFFTHGSPTLSRIDGLFLLGMFGLFLFYVFKQLKSEAAPMAQDYKAQSNLKLLTYISLGLAGLVIGGQLIVNNAVLLAQDLGVSEKVIGLTIVAAGTSLPELSTSIVAALKKNNDIAVGNIIGSNIFNIFLILSVSSIIKPIPFDVRFNTELYLLGGGTLYLFVAMFTGQKKKLDRWEAIILFIAFLTYTIYLVAKAM